MGWRRSGKRSGRARWRGRAFGPRCGFRTARRITAKSTPAELETRDLARFVPEESDLLAGIRFHDLENIAGKRLHQAKFSESEAIRGLADQSPVCLQYAQGFSGRWFVVRADQFRPPRAGGGRSLGPAAWREAGEREEEDGVRKGGRLFFQRSTFDEVAADMITECGKLRDANRNAMGDGNSTLIGSDSDPAGIIPGTSGSRGAVLRKFRAQCPWFPLCGLARRQRAAH